MRYLKFFNRKLLFSLVFLIQGICAATVFFKMLAEQRNHSWIAALSAACNAAAGIYFLDGYLDEVKYQIRLENSPVTVYDDGNFYDDDIYALSDEELNELL